MNQKRTFIDQENQVNSEATTSQLIDSDKDVQAYIYQQIAEFESFVTPETLVMVIARDPHEKIEDFEADLKDSSKNMHRIAIILKEGDTTIESEARHSDIYTAIKTAKEQLIQQLVEIQNEVESPQERMKAIHQARNTDQIH